MNDLLIDSDLTLVEGLKCRKRNSYKAFVDKYSRLIISSCYYSCGNYEDAFEEFNDILSKIFDKIDQFNPSKSSFKTWCMTITKNHLKDRFRKNKEVIPEYSFEECELDNILSSPDESDDNSVDCNYNQDDDEDVICMQKALLSISERDQAIVKYRADGFGNAEISEFFGIKENAVKTAYSRALKKIEQRYIEIKNTKDEI